MLIRCLQERAGGTHVDFRDGRGPRRGYRFAPLEPGGDHVCEVADLHHIKRLVVDVPESFVPADGAKLPPGIKLPEPRANAKSESPPVLIEALSNRELIAWLMRRGVNYMSGEEIDAFAARHGVKYDRGLRWQDRTLAIIHKIGYGERAA